MVSSLQPALHFVNKLGRGILGIRGEILDGYDRGLTKNVSVFFMGSICCVIITQRHNNCK